MDILYDAVLAAEEIRWRPTNCQHVQLTVFLFSRIGF